MPHANMPGVGTGKTQLRAADSQELPASSYTTQVSKQTECFLQTEQSPHRTWSPSSYKTVVLIPYLHQQLSG